MRSDLADASCCAHGRAAIHGRLLRRYGRNAAKLAAEHDSCAQELALLD